MRHQSLVRQSLLVALVFGLIPRAAAAQSPGQSAPRPDTPVALMPAVPPAPAAVRVEPGAPIPNPPAASNWTGLYVGASVVFNTGNADTSFDPLPTAAQFVNLLPTTLTPDPSGISVRVHGGINFAAGPLIIGGEGDVSLANPDGLVNVSPIPQNNGTPFPGAGFLGANQTTNWIVTARARVGLPIGRVLVFGTGGLAAGRIEYYAETNFRPVGTTDYLSDFTKNKIGWTAGGGAEIRITSNLSARGEFRYLDLGSEAATVDAAPLLPPFQVAYTWQTTWKTVSGGISVRF